MGIASIAEGLLAPAVSSLVGPLVQSIAGPLTNAVGAGTGDLIGMLEKAFLGPLANLGQGLTPPPGQYSQLPQPFAPPQFINDPWGSKSSSNPFSDDNIASFGASIDQIQQKALNVLKDPNATQSQILVAQNDLAKSNVALEAFSKILDQRTQQELQAVNAGAKA